MVVPNSALSRVSFRLDSLRPGECRRQLQLPLMNMSEQALPLLVCPSKHHLVEQLLGLGKPLVMPFPGFTKQVPILSTALGLTETKALSK